MTLHVWWLFVLAVVVLCGTPGPNMLHVMTRSVRFGLRRSLAAMAGCLVALVIVLCASALGLSAVMMASPWVFGVLRYVGVAYLLYLGIRAWRGGDAPLDVGSGAIGAYGSSAQLFRGGFAIGISNPKLLLFAAAFLPQFADRAQPQGTQFAILIATFAVVEAVWYAIYATGGAKLVAYLDRPAAMRTFNRVTGALFIGFGVALLGVRV
ncbi:LysE family translocator [Sphingomonas prati]|uniref:Threonine/homoserine/homoserine lactone efflux protein n=1 Tax=Sphingomonas prati TaxID=1843237 RepID=A0A7W9BT47_9SPHN|nr:LysE family translocator [Sphingomonas prati]MBB5729644.1 threonine/homoserine/homoserine lactone efflux protein [Sphingomonas prati]GGE75862.1 amino acid transporter [Sphingomonas prati]